MLTRTTRRALVALTTALACLALMASPASASAGTITESSFRVTGGIEVIDFETPSTGTPFCETPDATIDADIASGNVDVNAFSSLSSFDFKGDEYVLELANEPSLDTTGSFNSSTGAITGLEVGLVGEITNATVDVNGDCVQGAVRCTGIFVQLALSGESDGGDPDASGDVVSLRGDSNGSILQSITITGSCLTPFDVFNGGSIEIPAPTSPPGADLTFEFS